MPAEVQLLEILRIKYGEQELAYYLPPQAGSSLTLYIISMREEKRQNKIVADLECELMVYRNVQR